MVGEAINELAARVTEPAHELPTPGVANRLLCRVVRRVRHEQRRPWDGRWAMPDPAGSPRPGVGSFEAEVVDRLALEEFRRRLLAEPKGADAWAMLVTRLPRLGCRRRLGSGCRRRSGLGWGRTGGGCGRLAAASLVA